jgi:hypothetical protein
MPRRHPALLLALLLCLGAVAATPAAAEEAFADDCYDGAAAEASALRPHIWASESTENPWAVHREALDLRAGWVGATFDDDEQVDGFTANIQVTGMPVYPLNSLYRFNYSGPLGQHFVVAQATETGWRFTYGHLDTSETPNRQVTDGTTEGTADEAAGIITIDLPEEAVPAPPEDGEEVTMPLTGMSSHTVIGTGTSGGLILLVDQSAWVCTAVLYEAEEDEESDPQ